jgi:hypothetical protein
LYCKVIPLLDSGVSTFLKNPLIGLGYFPGALVDESRQ